MDLYLAGEHPVKNGTKAIQRGGAITNTLKIANKCNVELEFKGYQLPKYSDEIDASLYLRELCYKGLKKRLVQNNVRNIKVYEERLIYELETIKELVTKAMELGQPLNVPLEIDINYGNSWKEN